MKNETMTIKVLGSGCATCKKLYELTKQAVTELGLKTEVEYITDIQKIVEMGVMQSPVLAINDKPVIVGAILDLGKIKEIINDSCNNLDPKNKRAGCSCGGNC